MYARSRGKSSSKRPRRPSVNALARAEKDITKQIGDYLDLLMRAGRLWHTRLNSGLARGVQGGWVHLCRTGTPDRMVLLGGTVVFFEVKKPGEEPTKEQLEQHELLRAQGAHVYVVRSLPEVASVLTAHQTPRTV